MPFQLLRCHDGSPGKAVTTLFTTLLRPNGLSRNPRFFPTGKWGDVVHTPEDVLDPEQVVLPARIVEAAADDADDRLRPGPEFDDGFHGSSPCGACPCERGTATLLPDRGSPRSALLAVGLLSDW